jgi:hypothetical protein
MLTRKESKALKQALRREEPILPGSPLDQHLMMVWMVQLASPSLMDH